MKKGDLKIDEKTAVQCPTEELARQVLTIADSLGYKWGNGNSFIKTTNWRVFGCFTGYSLSKGKYAATWEYKPEGFNIISAEEFINLHNMEERTVKLDLNTARECYKKGGELKEVALQAYTKKELATDVKEKIKTFEDALEELTEKGDKLVRQYEDYIRSVNVDDGNLLAYIKLRIICRALNEREVIFSKDVLYSPYIRFISVEEYEDLSDIQKERSVLFGGYANNGSDAGVMYSYSVSAPAVAAASAAIGSRLCLLESDLAIYCCKQFPDLWLTYLTK